MISDSELILMSSQELKYIAEDPLINGLVNDNTCILDEEDANLPDEYNEVPSGEDFPGPYKFDAFVNPQESKNLMYSAILNKVFIISNTDFPVEFKWTNLESFFNIRAMPIYSSPHDAHKPVIRCIQHAQSSDVSNAGFTKLQSKHIMRCKNDQCRYEGGLHKHFSVVAPLGRPQPGIDTVSQRFVFVCKNSCASGMDRRPIKVIFTLEGIDGAVYGRKCVNVRVCSCPKRDKDKEEQDHFKNQGGPTVRGGKKRKLVTTKKPLSFSDANDGATYSVNINVIGRRNYKAVIKYAQDLMAAEIVRYGNEEPFTTAYNELGNVLRNQD